MSRRRFRTTAALMYSVAFAVTFTILASTPIAGAAGCCQSCESLDATCGSACDSQCDGNSSCLQTCYNDCESRSSACWGNCIYCSYSACTYVWWLVETSTGHILDSWCS